MVRMATASQEDRIRWLRSLPSVITEVAERWSLSVGSPFRPVEEGSAWVAPATDRNGTDAVLKISFPHFEEEHENQGLRFWDGEPTVRLLDGDDQLHALLLERCLPGTSLRDAPEAEQDMVVAGLLRRIWRRPPASFPFRSLNTMLAYWRVEAEEAMSHWADPGLVREGLELFRSLPRSATSNVLLATDLHAGNVLRSFREPWLVIDPKPFLGDPAYDATQHLLNCADLLLAHPDRTIKEFAELLEVDAQRVGLWTFARAAVLSGAGHVEVDWPLSLVLALKASISF